MSKTQWTAISAGIMFIVIVVSLFISDEASMWLWNIVNLFM